MATTTVYKFPYPTGQDSLSSLSQFIQDLATRIETTYTLMGIDAAFTNLIQSGDAASGDLTGTYPNPTIKVNAINNSMIQTAAVSSDEIQDGAVGAAEIATSVNLNGSPTTTTPVTSDNSTKIATTSFVNAVAANFVLGVLSSNSIVDSMVSVSAAISYSKLNLALSIVNADVALGAAIAYSKLALTGAILNTDLAGSIAYNKLSLTNAILNADLAGSIASSKITGTAITAADTGTVTSTMILDNTIASNDISTAYPGHLVVANTAARPAGAAGQMIYQTDTDELLKYVSYGGANRWMKSEIKPNRNAIVNGGFAVDQRNAGASQTITAAAALAYTTDRWYAYCTGANVTTQRVTGAVPYQYYYRVTGLVSNTAVGIGTRLEAANTYLLANTTATLSGWFASTSLTSITWTAYYATTTDSFGTVAVPTRTQIATGTFTISSTLGYQSVAISIPAAATTGIEVVFTTGALLGSQTLTITGVQLEQGAAPSTFEFREYGDEVRRCQRYYFRTIADATNTQKHFGTGFANSATVAEIIIPFPVVMRTTASVDAVAANLRLSDNTTNTALSVAPAVVALASSEYLGVVNCTVAAGLTAFRPMVLQSAAAAAGYIGFSAEL